MTLTGPGRAGKTSLAVETAAHVTDAYGDGVWLIRLAGVTDPAHLPQAIADTLGVPDGSGTVEDRLVRFLSERTCLLLVDNCEHLIDAAAALVERLLVACDPLRVLATSREPLAVPGEVQLSIPPLDTPPADAAPQEMPAYDAVRLFLDQARAVLPAFRLDATTAAPVAEVCRHLDGIPLAIELAAARVKTLSIGEIAARLDDRFRLLTAGPRTAEARQRTLRATVDWSQQLLTEPERVLFRRLAAFRGGWSADAAVFAAELVDPARKGRAVALVFSGLTASTVLGAPLGAAVGQALGWRFTFWTLVVFGGIALLGLLASLPRTAPAATHQHHAAEPAHPAQGQSHGHEHSHRHEDSPAAAEFEGLDAHALAHLGGGGHGHTLRQQVAALGRPAVWAVLLTTLLGYGGVFTSYVYIARQLTDVAGFDRVWITPLLLLLSAGLSLGNHLGGRLADRRLMPAISARSAPWRSRCSRWVRPCTAGP